jgi:2-iminobutanoate/2-iminopropanoate deaminase
MAKIEPYAAKSVYDPPAYAQAVKVSGADTILYLSGQVDYDAAGNCAHPGDFAAQAKGVLDAIKAQIEAGGGTMANIVKVNTYVTDMRHRPDWARVRAEYFGPKMSASTMVGVTSLAHPDFLIEVEAIVVF